MKREQNSRFTQHGSLETGGKDCETGRQAVWEESSSFGRQIGGSRKELQFDSRAQIRY
jgi:hypothetical protein